MNVTTRLNDNLSVKQNTANMSEMDYGLKKMNEMYSCLKEINDNVKKVEVMWGWVIISWCGINKHVGYGAICLL